MATVHVFPIGDLVEHDTSGDQPGCVCGPALEHVPNPHGPDGWLVTHHSLDGREEREGEN
jgi:hypothetical protein